MQKAADDQRSMHMMLRAIANGIISERDRLFEYTNGELFQEMSLFIEEGKIKSAAFEKLTNKQ